MVSSLPIMKKKVIVKKVVKKSAKKIVKPKVVKVQVKAKAKAKITPKPKVQPKAKATPKVAPKATPKAKVAIKAKPKVKQMTMPTPAKAIQSPYQEIKIMLERQKHALLVEAGATLESTLNPSIEGFPDWTDQATMEVDQNCVLRLREREQHLLNKIEDAIERIDRDAFGICETCSAPISLKRLTARPVTTLCIECKTKQEYEEKMRQ